MNTGYIDKFRVKKFNLKKLKSVKKEKEALNYASFPNIFAQSYLKANNINYMIIRMMT